MGAWVGPTPGAPELQDQRLLHEACVLPTEHRLFLSQVMELKGLSWLLVGMVTCASADFFVSKPQLMLVDITELGTIKLQLEIAWTYGHTGALNPSFLLPRISQRRKLFVFFGFVFHVC